MIELSDEQKEMLLFLGSPDDGSQTHVVEDGERLIRELVRMGLVSCDKDSHGIDHYDLTDRGRRMYGELGGKRGW